MTLQRGDWFYILLLLLTGFFMARPYLYAIQNDNYRLSEIFGNRRLRTVYLIDVISVAVFFSVWLGFYFFQAKAFWGFLIALFFFVTEIALYFMEDLPDRKKPLKYTKRAVRCLIFVSVGACAAGTCALALVNAKLADSYLRYLVFFGFVLFFPLMFIIFASIINVFEKLNNRRFEMRTARRLKNRPDLIKIAITGSYGKTSVKNYIATILSQKYNVLATPESYNTPMGISKTVNSLDPTHEVFIAEFGARRKGDVKRLMQIVKPQIAVLTGINEQHLETFKTFDNIKREKCRILEVGDGTCVINGKLRSVTEPKLISQNPIPEVIYAGFDDECDVRAVNISVAKDGSDFDVEIGDEVFCAHTNLLGIHNVENVLLAVGVAMKLGVEIPYIQNGIQSLQAVPHRQQLVKGNGITIIDDSFNSNPDGARLALDTLAMFDTRKVVMTPGLVELGKNEEQENEKLGEYISAIADVVLLVGKKRSLVFNRALKRCGFGGEIYVYESLKDCENDFSNTLKVGDTLLILNDLPDIFDDKV